MKLQNPKSKIQNPKGLPRVGIILAVVAWILQFVLVTQAQEDTNEIPHLRPLHAEVPPTFWEQHGLLLVVLGAVLVFAVGLAIWLLTRPQPPVVVPPEVQARDALTTLPAHLGEGAKLSRISQILREYVRRAFELPAGELTTTEFCQLLSAQPQVGPELAGVLTEFLRDNDRRKFSSASGPAASVNAVTVALSLIEKAEARRTSQRAAAAGSASVTRT